MTERNLKVTVFISTSLCLLLAAALAYVVMRRSGHAQAQSEVDAVVARGPEAAASTPATHNAAAMNSDDPALAPIQLTPQRIQEIGVTTAVAEMKTASDAIQAPGNVAIDEQRLAYVQTRFPGWIREVFANATYQYVKKGQRLFTIYSPDLVSTQQEVLLAKQNQQASTEHDHMHGTAANESNWLLQAAEERLRRFDIPASEIASFEQSGKVQREIAIESPASGYIIERNALPNAYVQPDTKLYTIADLSTVWVYANIFQNDVGRLKPGDTAQVTVDAYPGRKFSGRIDQILPDVDMTTRTVRARLVFSNPGLLLKPGMYVNVQIAAPLGKQLMIPSTAVLQAGSRQIAFLERGNGLLEPRQIETGLRVDDSVTVISGLHAGDRVVSSANFLVDSEAQLQAAMGGAIPAQSASSTPQTPAQPQARIDFDSRPSPPQRGSNTVSVKLTGVDGKPVTGAQVGVVFYMPAMPAMGMAAMHQAVNLTDKGAGNYEGPLQLGSGGTWDVTITATRNGEVLATKKMSINVTGGM